MISKTQDMFYGMERTLLPLSEAFPVTDFQKGDLCSVDREGSVVPLSDALPFGGVLDGVGQERGRWLCSLLICGTISVPIHGLTPDTKLGCTVYATRTGGDEHFSFDGPGTVVGELCGIDSVERGIGIVAIKVKRLQT